MKCQIQWIDKQGNPTPDNNEAIGIAKSTITYHRNKDVVTQVFPICEDHYNSETFWDREDNGQYTTNLWRFIPFKEVDQCND